MASLSSSSSSSSTSSGGKTRLQGKEANEKMSVVRQQVSTLLGAAMKGELLDLQAFLNDFAAAQLREDRTTYGLGDGDDSDDDDYPEGHFGKGADGKPLAKPPREERLLALKRDAVRDFRDGNGRTAVHFAATSGHEAVTRELLRLVPDAHALVDDNGATALVLVAGQDCSGSDTLVEILLGAGADVAAADKDGVQALHHAAAADRVKAIELLAAAGAPLDSPTKSGTGAPLHWAAGEGAHRAVASLVALGAQLDAPDGRGLPPVIMAAASGSQDGSKCVAALARGGADCGHLLGGGLTVLHVCADLGMAEACAALVQTPTGRDCCRRRSDDGKLPVQLAAAGEFREVVALLRPLSFDFTDGAGAQESPTVDELMLQGLEATATAEIAEKKAKADADAVATAKQAALIENTKPAQSEEASKAAQAAKAEGNTAFQAKDFQTAADRYTDAIKLDGTDAVFFSNRSACWLELGQKERALADAEHCRKLRPEWAKACFRMAAARMALEQFEDAAVAAFEGLKIDDQNSALKKIMKQAVAKGREQQASLSSTKVAF